ncbi:Chemotaxis protein methyltransferase [Andreprevotia sp. IGB-42]|uniref:CheR family methyltransferase n=1 Tax=Andreprevotia sp. IGB-42 TaxID=2497473 RepID=UPI00157F26FB|nr:protein-glutamate O-methyltransferase CheR [Andreprevotia sp. IGB-42]KAF0815334.1 Chemotaxis protein methyltransferase [Andreprevotia sp. IGB-42]
MALPSASPAADIALLTRFAGFLVSSIGLHYPAARHADLLRGMAAVAQECGDADVQACMQRLMAAPLSRHDVEVVARHLTIGETYFYREPAVFDALEREILPALIQARRASGNLSLRLWSAACCSGEEPYSMAILLARLLPDLPAWRIAILGTDINPLALARARAAVYPQWSFRNTPPWVRNGYFKVLPSNHMALLPRIKDMVTFSYLNLVEDSYPAVENNTNALDLIMCRNVLIYFDAQRVEKVVGNLRRALRDDGWLAVGAVETNQQIFHDFQTVNFPDAVIYRKPQPDQGADLRQPLAWLTEALDDLPLATTGEPQPLQAQPTSVSEDAASADAHYQQAQAHYQRGEYERAAQLLGSGVDDTRSLLLLAHIHANLGELHQASRCCERAIASDRLNPGCQYLLSAVQEELGQTDEAMAALRRAIYLDPDFVLAHFALGNLKRRLGIAGAARHFANARELLARYDANALLPESEGMTAGRLAEIIALGNTSP